MTTTLQAHSRPASAWARPAWGRQLGDWLVAGGSLALGLTFLATNSWLAGLVGSGPAPRATWVPWAVGGLLAVTACALLWRRRHPVAVFAVAWAVFVAVALIDPYTDNPASPGLWIAAYLLALNCRAGVAIPVLLGAAAGQVALQASQVWRMGSVEPLGWGTVIALLVVRVTLVYLVCGLLGTWVSLQRHRTQLATERSRLIQEGAEARAREEVARERARMARELHDVAAHHLSGIAIQSGAAIRLFESDPELAAQLLRDIRQQSQVTLTAMRQIVGILREGGSDGLAPPAMLPDAGALIESARRAGAEAGFRTEGQLGDLPDAISLACYRIVQESLTNALKHAPGEPISVEVRREPDAVAIEVRNGLPGVRAAPVADDGFGLAGMRERVALLCGSFDAGPRENTWRVRASIPVAQQEATP